MARCWSWVSAALLLAACGSQSSSPMPAPQAPGGEKMTVRESEIPQLKPLAAEISTRNQAEALTRIPGILVALDVREGDVVARGDIIGRVVDSRLGYETGAYQAQAIAAAAQAEAARAELSRIDYLYKRSVYAKARLDQAEAAARSADANLRAARSQRAASAAIAGQGLVLAPANGRVLRADIPQGSAVVPGTSIATITAGPPLLRLDVPDSLARQLHKGASVTVQDESELNGRRGTIVQVYPAVSGGRVRADVALANLTTDLVGRRVSVVADLGTRRGILVPRRFVATRFGIDYVAVVGKDGATTSVSVQTAPANGPGQIELLSGVLPGDVLLAQGKRQ